MKSSSSTSAFSFKNITLIFCLFLTRSVWTLIFKKYFVYLSQWAEVKKTQTGNQLMLHKKLQNFQTLKYNFEKEEKKSEPAPNYLQVFWDEDLASFLDHGLRFQLLGWELALAWVEHLLPRHAGQSQVSRVRLVSNRNLDGVWVDGAGSVSGVWEAWRKRSQSLNGLGHMSHTKFPVWSRIWSDKTIKTKTRQNWWASHQFSAEETWKVSHDSAVTDCVQRLTQ